NTRGRGGCACIRPGKGKNPGVARNGCHQRDGDAGRTFSARGGQRGRGEKCLPVVGGEGGGRRAERGAGGEKIFGVGRGWGGGESVFGPTLKSGRRVEGGKEGNPGTRCGWGFWGDGGKFETRKNAGGGEGCVSLKTVGGVYDRQFEISTSSAVIDRRYSK